MGNEKEETGRCVEARGKKERHVGCEREKIVRGGGREQRERKERGIWERKQKRPSRVCSENKRERGLRGGEREKRHVGSERVKKVVWAVRERKEKGACGQ